MCWGTCLCRQSPTDFAEETFEENSIANALYELCYISYLGKAGAFSGSLRLGNATVYGLGAMPGLEGVSKLSLLKTKIKAKNCVVIIDKALSSAATRCGVSVDELREMYVLTYGMTEVGKRMDSFGEFVATLEITSCSLTQLTWSKNGKHQKNVPVNVKENYNDELKALKSSSMEIKKMLSAQKDRIDRLFVQRRTWKYPVWRERYLDHFLVGFITRRLIWRFFEDDKSSDAVFFQGNFLNSSGEPLNWMGSNTDVELWHPIGKSTPEILMWRDLLAKLQIVQPFKQAHREIYLITDAERKTRIYSNRFASHIVKQHQFKALCDAREWKYKLKLLVDAEFPPAFIDLPAYGLRAEFWTDSINEDINDTGTFYHVATDQVRFYRIDNPISHIDNGFGGRNIREIEPLPIEDVPPLVLSEVFRDVDLFVGVSSIGNNPAWVDTGERGALRDYWFDYSFAELSESAKMRMKILEGIIPRLKIADRCSFTDKYLIVRGALRTYRIHIGSTNILMEPGNQYLCIVMGRGSLDSKKEKIYLPFEGDNGISLIISKALMLANDDKITDSTIVNQIKNK